MKTAKILGAALLSVSSLAAATTARAADLWIHVHVDEQGDSPAKVRVNLPVTLIETALGMVEDEHLRSGKVVLDQHELTVAELRALWNQVKAAPDATFVEVEEADESVKVSKRGAYLLVHVDDRAQAEGDGPGKVDVKIPHAVVEALLSGEGEDLDVGAALRALADHGEGELVTVDDRDAKVRIWVDASAESR
jgi:hypothetical protein